MSVMFAWPPASAATWLLLGMSAAVTAAPMEEVVVAGFRDQSASRLDGSVTVLGDAELRELSVEHFEELVRRVPNMNWSGEGSRARYWQLRGVGEREQYEGAPNPSVGFIVDDIDLSGVGGIASLFDINQVDVLRGPQSTRYGSNALAGLVYMQSTAPEDTPSADIETTVGSEETRSIGVAAGGPLADDLAGRVALHYYADNGFRDNAQLGRDDSNDRDELTARARLRWTSGDWVAVLSGLYADYDNGYDAWSVDNSATTWSDQPGEDGQQTTAGSLKISGPLNAAMTLVSITAAASSDIDFSYDGDWGGPGLWSPYTYDYVYENPRDREAVSQELRLVSTPAGRLFGGTTDWVAGVYWQRLDEDNDIHSRGIYDDSAAENFCPPGICVTDREVSSNYSANHYDAFVSLDATLAGKFGVSMGLRYSHWDASYADDWQDAALGLSAANHFSPDEDMVGGHIAFSYDWTATQYGYLRIARGFKAGGFNPSLAALSSLPGAQLDAAYIAYQPEYLWNTELGLNSQWLEGRLATAVSVFYMDRDDAQLSQSSQQIAGDPNSFVFVTSNGDASVYGLEASAELELSDAWQLYADLGLLASEIDQWPVRPAVQGRELAHAPRYTAALGLRWSGPQGWFARIDGGLVDEFYFDISHDQESEAYQVVNLRAGREWGRWSVTAWVSNAFDEHYATRGFYFGNEPPDFADTLYTKFGNPRVYGMTLGFRL